MMEIESVPKIDKFFQNIDVVSVKDQIKEGEYNPEHVMLDYEDTWYTEATFKEVKAAFEAYQKKICLKGFGPRCSPSSSLNNGAVYTLTRVLERIKAPEKDKQEVIYQFWKAMITFGPGSGHLDCFSIFASDLESYIETFEVAKLKDLIQTVKKEFTCPDSCDKEVYAQLFDVHDIFERTLSAKQYRSVKEDITDLCLFYLTRMDQVEPYSAKCMFKMVRACHRSHGNPYKLRKKFLAIFESHLDEEDNVWTYLNCLQGIANAAFYKKHVTTLKEVLQKAKFTKDLSSRIEDTLTAIFESCREAGLAGELFPELVNVLTAMCRNETWRNQKCMECFSYLFDNTVDLTTSEHKVKVFTSCCDALIMCLETRPVTEPIEYAVSKACWNIVVNFKATTKELVPVATSLLKCLLQSSSKELVAYAKLMIDDGPLKTSRTFNWKNYIRDARSIIEFVGQVKVEDSLGEEDEVLEEYGEFIAKFLDCLRKCKISGHVSDSIVNCIFSCLTMDPPKKNPIAYKCSDKDFIDLTRQTGLVGEILKKVNKLLKDPDYPYLDTDFRYAADLLLQECLNAFSDGKTIPKEYNELFVKVIKTCLEGDVPDKFFDPDDCDRKTVFFYVYQNIATGFVNKHCGSNTLEAAAPILPDIVRCLRACKDEEDNDLTFPGFTIFESIGRKNAKIAAHHMDFMVELFLGWKKCSETFSFLQAACEDFPEAIVDKLDVFMKKMEKFNESNRHLLLTVLCDLSHWHAEAFQQAHIKCLLDRYGKEKSDNSLILTIFRNISEKCPENLKDHFDVLMDDKKFAPSSLNVRSSMIGCVGLLGETQAKKAIDYLMKHINTRNPTLCSIVMGQLCLFGNDYMEMLKPHKQSVETLQKKSQLPQVKQLCQHIINIIEGKNVENLADDIQEVQQDVNKLNTRVGSTEVAVATVGAQVDKQKKGIKQVKKGVKVVEKKVDEVKTDLRETKVKVEEIDNKTMTNAPKWSRDLTKLMNPEGEADWRLLALRLGYNNDDIRAWATQHDPCMALLSEWYATHKTSEATYGILKILQEIDRMDGAAIVENAMKAAEGVVEDEDFEYPSPPPIFLSYQWGFQDEVRLLNKHLEKAGYQCWMDLGQMGGGDKLFEKIDSGIRAAKIIICCVTEKYAQSPNCNREVNLSVNLGKPMIPLLMEKMSWPPKGSMGPIFSEYLFIRFFQRGGEETKDDRYWPVPKFQELLMQFNGLNVVPDESAISKEYLNWWIPFEAKIKIDKTKGQKGSGTTQQATEPAFDEKSPEVFISYQWGKQPQIIALYKRLTGLGYHCWMDIHQMGGGDSLYDKIDRGVRGCKVVLSCVTQKYSLSANCRREVSLADALKKPLIPLLLEQMEWPPTGPMSMVLTQLLYINFYRDLEVQTRWSGPQFEELLGKIKTYVPNVQPVTMGAAVHRGNQTSKENNSKGQIKSPAKAMSVKEKEENPIAEKKVDSKHAPAKEQPTRGQGGKGQQGSSQSSKENNSKGRTNSPSKATIMKEKKEKSEVEKKDSKQAPSKVQNVRGQEGKSQQVINQSASAQNSKTQHIGGQNENSQQVKEQYGKPTNVRNQIGSSPKVDNSKQPANVALQERPAEKGSKSCQIQ